MDQEIQERLKGKYGGQMRGHKEEGEGGGEPRSRVTPPNHHE